VGTLPKNREELRHFQPSTTCDKGNIFRDSPPEKTGGSGNGSLDRDDGRDYLEIDPRKAVGTMSLR